MVGGVVVARGLVASAGGGMGGGGLVKGFVPTLPSSINNIVNKLLWVQNSAGDS